MASEIDSAPISEELMTILKENGYVGLIKLKNKGICGLSRLLYTTGIVYGLDPFGYEGRYCYNSFVEAALALAKWDGEDDPSGNWIVHKTNGGNIRKDGTKY